MITKYVTTFETTLPSGLTVDVDAIGHYNPNNNTFTNIELSFFEIDGQELNMNLDGDSYATVEYLAETELFKMIDHDEDYDGVIPLDKFGGYDDSY